MRILLIDPPFYRFMGFLTRYFPYGLATLAAHARALGHEPLVYDADHDARARGVDYQGLPRRYPDYSAGVADEGSPIWKELDHTLAVTRPQWVGISALTAKMASVMQVASRVRARLPHVPIVVGGPHAMVRPMEILENAPEVDGVVVGEGEPVLGTILVEDRAAIETLGRETPGLVTRTGNCITEVPPAALERLGHPTRDLFVRGSYSREDLGLVMTSRGCPFGCTYCFTKGLWRRRVRLVPLEVLEAEFDEITRQGVRHVAFKDDVFTLDAKRTLAIAELLHRRGMTWDCVTRVDRIDERLLSAMRGLGCRGVKVGVETGSEPMMQRLDRSLSAARIRDAAAMLRRSGLHWTAYFMMGLPGESLEDVHATDRFMRELAPDFASLSGYEAFPGTALFDWALERGVVMETMPRDAYFRMSPHDYYFIRDDRGMILPPGVSYSTVESAMHARFHHYNAALPRVAKRLRSRVAVWRGEPTLALHDAGRLISWLASRSRPGPGAAP
ncbi:B12-binding domain-containing radical SAM protein [Candidatus Fermentibacteria bacterium]|nr:B12-binding domain-containing radical SAM protein [Candidatus Fermentibacteria bacterium]